MHGGRFCQIGCIFVASTGSAGIGSMSASQLPTPRIDEYQYMPLYQGFSGKNAVFFLQQCIPRKVF